MKFFDVLNERRSTRAYKQAPVPEESLKKILEAAVSAPSAGNLQAYEMVIIRDRTGLTRLARTASRQAFMENAPLAIVFLANPQRNRPTFGERADELLAAQDATIACAYAELAAAALGLGACWIGDFDEEEVRAVTGAPEEWKPVAIMPLGYTVEKAPSRNRRPLNTIVHEGMARKS
ncbi:MAG: nitroreductase family protein [bacterium]